MPAPIENHFDPEKNQIGATEQLDRALAAFAQAGRELGLITN